jgi:hypothetical protein
MLTPEQIIRNFSSENIERFVAYDGAYELLSAWQRHILSGGVHLNQETFNFEEQFEKERERYARVAFAIIKDFVSWATTHPHE